jgi:hypothetical protein
MSRVDPNGDSRRALIARLSATLPPVRRPWPPLRVALLYWLATWGLVVAVGLAVAPARPNAVLQAITHPQFLLESLLGLIAGAAVVAFAFADSVPGYARRGAMSAALVLAVAWALAYVVGLEYPALPPSMAGKRPLCFYETLAYGAPAALVAWMLVLRYYPLAPVRSAALLGLAAGIVPALFMQFACMYDPAHILTHHILPIPLLVAASVAVAWPMRRRVARRRRRPS